ncbi:MAG TPA: hypothetical protein VGM10_30110 [Actinocrinis sp.]|jgi:hypothetical protein
MSALTHTPLPDAPAASGGARSGGARLVDLAWLTWRQHRATIIAGLIVAAMITISMVYVAARIATINQECGNTQCPDGSPQAAPLSGAFGLDNLSTYLAVFAAFMPVLTGMFLGVPVLAREHEQRTLLLAWSQDVTPHRWLWTKIALLGALTAALGAAVSVAAARLADVSSVASGGSMFAVNPFLTTDMLPLVLSVVWFAVGVALGAAFRRTLPAAFSALAGCVGLLLLVQWRYPTFTTPLTTLVPIGGGAGPNGQLGANSLIVDQGSGVFDASGHAVSRTTVETLCSVGNADFVDGRCLAQHGFRTELSYQPGSRIPEFHLILMCGYLGVGVLALVAVWWLVRRTSLSAG